VLKQLLGIVELISRPEQLEDRHSFCLFHNLVVQQLLLILQWLMLILMTLAGAALMTGAPMVTSDIPAGGFAAPSSQNLLPVQLIDCSGTNFSSECSRMFSQEKDANQEYTSIDDTNKFVEAHPFSRLSTTNFHQI
jgi:hypothetical protein